MQINIMLIACVLSAILLPKHGDAQASENNIYEEFSAYYETLNKEGFILKRQYEQKIESWVATDNTKHLLLSNLVKWGKLNTLKEIISIKGIFIQDEQMLEKGTRGTLAFEIWEFGTNNDAKKYFDLIMNNVRPGGDIDKPPQDLFLHDRTLFYFVTGRFDNYLYISRVKVILLSQHFKDVKIEGRELFWPLE